MRLGLELHSLRVREKEQERKREREKEGERERERDQSFTAPPSHQLGSSAGKGLMCRCLRSFWCSIQISSGFFLGQAIRATAQPPPRPDAWSWQRSPTSMRTCGTSLKQKHARADASLSLSLSLSLCLSVSLSLSLSLPPSLALCLSLSLSLSLSQPLAQVCNAGN